MARPSPSPELQAEWADLQKSDDVLRINYQQLIGKREGARMAQALYGADGTGKYQITRLPTVPEIGAPPPEILPSATVRVEEVCASQLPVLVTTVTCHRPS